MWTTNPQLASLLSNPNDGYCYTEQTNRKLNWTCKDCGKEFSMTANKLAKRLYKCPYCPHSNSYGEKFIYNMLEQLCMSFNTHVRFDWSDMKEYDFYIPEYNCIIEVHGAQHYTSHDFSHKSGRAYYEEQVNDDYKKELALINGVAHYIIIDARKSDLQWIKYSVRRSGLQDILYFKST